MKAVLFSLILVASSGCATLGDGAYNDSKSAVRGYDSVTYLGSARPINGQTNITYRYRPDYGRQYYGLRHHGFHRQPYRQGFYRYYSRGYSFPYAHHRVGRLRGNRFHY